MNILFTGGSSFTGYWFIKQLASAGHHVTATFTRSAASDYADGGVREHRVTAVQKCCTPLWSCAFGDDAFMAAINAGNFDVLCHHAADVTNYNSPDFDASNAVANNTKNIQPVLDALKNKNPDVAILLTNSVFAGNEGAGTADQHGKLPHFSPYGLSKALTAEMFRYYADQAGLTLGEFVIPNPFGPHEEPRFTNYLVKTWFAKKTAGCNTPAYVRDNIHVELLARAYAHFARQLPGHADRNPKLSPCGYIESQGAFAQRFADAMRPRLGLDCTLELAHQTEFTQPRIRINTDTPDPEALGFDEAKAWDEVAQFYCGIYG